MNKLLVRFVTLFNPLWSKLGINVAQLEAILTTKLMMDGRRASLFNSAAKGTKKQVKNQDWLSLGMFFIFGIFFMSILMVFKVAATGFTLYFAAWLVTLALTLITDFTQVLIDVRDNYILLPRPINDRTLTAARILHIGLYLSRLVIAFALPGLIYLSTRYGIPGILTFLLQIFLSSIMVIFVVNFIYLLILRFTSPQKFREIINYFQIVFTVSILGSYYLLPNLIDLSAIESFNILESPYVYIIPSAWIAGLWSLIVEGNFTPEVLILSSLALLTPVICIYLVVNILARNFSQKMIALAAGSTAPKKEVSQPTNPAPNQRMYRLARLLNRSMSSRTGFEFAWLLTQRSRDYKLKVYPSFAFVPIIFLYFALNGDGTLQERLAEVASGKYYLLLAYFCLFLLTTPMMSLFYSDKYQAAWIFFANPVKHPGALITGACKAVIARFFIPFYLIVFGLSIAIWGVRVIDDFILAFFNLMFIAILLAYSNFRRFPFSNAWANQSKGEGFAVAMLTLILGGAMGGIHYLLADMTPFVLAMSVLVAGLLALCWRSYYLLPWEKLKIS